MQCPIAEPLPPPQLNKRNPHELHWRKEPPEWMGTCEKSYQRYYPHLVQDPCCLQCGAVPCPFDHDGDHKLRLQDLEFVRDLATERKQLAQQLRKLEDDMQALIDRENDWKAEQLLLQQQVKNYEQLKKEWFREKTLMEAEISRLQTLNDKHQQKLLDHRKDQQKILRLGKQLESLQQENEKLQQESETFRRMIVNQQSEINQIDKKAKVLEFDLEQSTTQVRTLKVQLDDSNVSLEKVRKELWDKEVDMKKLEDAMTSLIDELNKRTRLFEQKETESNSLIQELRERVMQLTQTLTDSQKQNNDLQQIVAELEAEAERLRLKLARDKRFKQFVDIKREVNDLKEQNETLLYKVYEQEQSKQLCTMKDNGPVRTGAKMIAANARVSSVKLNRPKSTRSLRPPSVDVSDHEPA